MRTRFRTDTLAVRHAHGYVVQTLADLGWAGLAASLLAAIAWLAAAARATGVHRRYRRLPFDAERVGMVTLAVVVIVFAIHSAVDWTWFVPANTGVALLCAGWVVGRGPLRHRLEHPDGPTRPPATWPHASRLARFANSVPPLHGLAAALVLVLALAAAWTAFQPVRAVHASDAAFERLDQGQPDAAADIARIATQRDPLSADPLFELAAIEQARGRSQEAETALAKAVQLEPANAEAWRRLGELRLDGARRSAGRAQRVPGGLLPRPARAGVDLGHARGRARRPGHDYARSARAMSAGAQQRRAAPRAHLNRVEPGPLERRPQRAARVEAQVLAERVEVRVEAQQGDQRALDAAVERER